MAVNNYVEYEKLPEKIAKLQGAGENIQAKFQAVYTAAQDMNKGWDGKRYVDVAKAFNDMIPSINELVKTLVTTVPDQLGQVAKNYASFNGTSVSYTPKAAKAIGNIPEGNPVGMKFNETEVTSAKDKIFKGFGDAESVMNNEAQAAVTSILASWRGEAADSFDTLFKTLKANILNQIGEVKQKVNENMAQTIEDARKTESNSTF